MFPLLIACVPFGPPAISGVVPPSKVVRQTEEAKSLQGNREKLAALYSGMVTSQAAQHMREIANAGKFEYAASILVVMTERKADRIVAALDDPALAAKFSSRLREIRERVVMERRP